MNKLGSYTSRSPETREKSELGVFIEKYRRTHTMVLVAMGVRFSQIRKDRTREKQYGHPTLWDLGVEETQDSGLALIPAFDKPLPSPGPRVPHQTAPGQLFPQACQGWGCGRSAPFIRFMS